MTRPRHFTREVRRLHDILAVLARHGLGDVAAHLRLPSSGVLRHAADASEGPLTRATRLRMALEELGPTFVKFGQALSLRSDLLPAALVDELSRLQDAAPALPAGVAEQVIEEALHCRLTTAFASFEASPLAAASIAQVHLARLPDGTPVAVKVRRPGIGAVIEADLDLLQTLATAVEHHWADAELYAPSALVRQFARTIRREQDLAREGRVLERVARNFAGDPTVMIPRVHWSHTAEAVLTLDHVTGVKVSDREGMRRQGNDLTAVARRGADAILRQVLSHGLFHADPHPGNILVQPGDVIALLDFGIVGHLDLRIRVALATLMAAVGARDIPRVVDGVLGLSEPLVPPDREELSADVSDLVESYAGARLQDLSLAHVWSEIAAITSRHRLKLPADLLLLVKALVTIEAVGRTLDPQFRMVEHATPFVQRFLRRQWQPRQMLARTGRASRALVSSLRLLPHDVHELLAGARDGRLRVQVHDDGMERLAGEVGNAGRRVGTALVLAATVLSAALLADGLQIEPRVLRLAAAIIAMALLVLIWPHRRRRASVDGRAAAAGRRR